jgi:hypothetical protein
MKSFLWRPRYASDNENDKDVVYADLKLPHPRKYASVQRLNAAEFADSSYTREPPGGNSTYYAKNGNNAGRPSTPAAGPYIRFGSSRDRQINNNNRQQYGVGGVAPISSYATNPRGGAAAGKWNSNSFHDLRSDMDISYTELRLKDGLPPLFMQRAEV